MSYGQMETSVGFSSTNRSMTRLLILVEGELQRRGAGGIFHPGIYCQEWASGGRDG